MSIVNLTSLSWGAQRYSAVAHSFRVMSKSRNFDEMVVGMMHELYGASSYTRALYSCDVDGDPAWKEALDLFVWPIRKWLETEKRWIPGSMIGCVTVSGRNNSLTTRCRSTRNPFDKQALWNSIL